ncbi:transketolase C-terminal domain-containing protein, partial [Staphylococcus epidermidis]|uniref:transketolase C-terminal domain-containing protein n=1 Tax=Staphylococcus epidermidis TaxID=1282 RepID=UPI0037D9AA38
ETAEKLPEHQVSLDLIHLPSLSPSHQQTLLHSVKKTGPLILIHQSNPHSNIPPHLPSLIPHLPFHYLHPPIN